jgi:hypothetical protein
LADLCREAARRHRQRFVDVWLDRHVRPGGNTTRQGGHRDRHPRDGDQGWTGRGTGQLHFAGYILTPALQDIIDRHDDAKAFHDSIALESTLGRLGSAGYVAEGYLYLASDAASWVTGTNLVVDGGITAGQLPNVDPRN